MLEDLEPYFVESEMLSLSDLWPSVQRAMELDGSIKQAISAVTVSGIVTNAELTDGVWSLTEYLTLLQDSSQTFFVVPLISLQNLTVNYQEIKEAYGEDVVLAGYPNKEKEPRYLLSAEVMLGINSASAHKEGAWAFLEVLLSYSYQKGLEDTLSVRWILRRLR